jgi:TonB family protein
MPPARNPGFSDQLIPMSRVKRSRHRLRVCLILFLVVVVVSSRWASAKPQTWIELHSPHFHVITNATEKQARHVAYQFEMIRAVFQEFFRLSSSGKDEPVIIVAAKDEETLKALLPGYWANKGSMHPAGIYLGGPEKNYVGLRLDVSMNQSAYEPYEPVYHEYVHYLTRRLMSQLPLWMVEGLAEFYGNTRIEAKTVYVGAPSTSNVMVLRQHRLLPLSTLFDVNASSPYYHEENKASIFYAESWALTHYLVVRDWRENTHRVADFIKLLDQNVTPMEAAQRTIGDPEALERALSVYVHNFAFNAARMDAPAMAATSFESRPLSDAESLAVRADFMAHDRYYGEAEKMLEESLKLDPKLSAAYESMGFLYTQQGKTSEAGKWYSEALALNSESYFAHYYYALNLIKGSPSDDWETKAELNLRAALTINSDFAPAYDALAYLLVNSSPLQVPEEAYTLAVHAIQIEPGNVQYRLRAVQVLERLGRADNAVRVATLAVSIAKTGREREEASAALSKAEQFQADEKRVEELKKAEDFKKLQALTASDKAAQTTLQTTEQKPEPISSDQKQSQNPGRSKVTFGATMSAESAIQQAQRAALENRSAYGEAGDYGLGQGTRGGQVIGPAEVLTDTKGFDFGPYVQRVIHDVKQNWYLLIPDVARPPVSKNGRVAIEFAIVKNGHVPAMQLVLSSLDVALDRAAWASITKSQPFPPLPAEFHGEYLALRFNYYYNPNKDDLQQSSGQR